MLPARPAVSNNILPENKLKGLSKKIRQSISWSLVTGEEMGRETSKAFRTGWVLQLHSSMQNLLFLQATISIVVASPALMITNGFRHLRMYTGVIHYKFRGMSPWGIMTIRAMCRLKSITAAKVNGGNCRTGITRK